MLTEEDIAKLAKQRFHATTATRILGTIDFVGPVYLVDCTIQSNVAIGRNSSIAAHTKVFSGVSIGSFCSIGNCSSIGASQHPIDWLSTSVTFCNGDLSTNPGVFPRFVSEKKTLIGNDVWIGSNVVIMTGIKIGDGAIVGAGSVVTRDVEPYEVVVGAPARQLRHRFTADIVERLLKLAWWNLDPALLYDLPADNIGECLVELERRAGHQSEKSKNL
jgi:virginiamycin A acetyltransferase